MAKVYISSYLKEFDAQEDNLTKVGIKYEILRNTKDIWVRDFMPIPLHWKNSDGTPLYAIYRYWPDYLDDEPDCKEDVYTITNQPDACRNIKIDHKHCVDLGLTFDGGNYVDCSDKAIITDKVFGENPNLSHEEVIRRLETTFRQEIIIIPWIPIKDDRFGHSDGFVQYVHGNKVLLYTPLEWVSDAERLMHERIEEILKRHGLKVVHLNVEPDHNVEKDNTWAYINFLKLNGKIYVPSANPKYDGDICNQIAEVYEMPIENVIMVNMNAKLLELGGALHCCTWTKEIDEDENTVLER